LDLGQKKIRQRPTLPPGFPSSTIGAEELNYRVRDGNGCDLFAIAAEKRTFNLVFFNLHIDTICAKQNRVNCFVAKPHDQLVPVS
jgi:hypothetical protein